MKTKKCPLGGDTTNNCADCVHSCDYHFVKGNCLIKKKRSKKKEPVQYEILDLQTGENLRTGPFLNQKKR